ncbi:hypothetical protein EVAR_90543_1 [Eumeta japonica]|uniref:Uncharacterized protein n=1 Tax=Eumeta variegata TaxID=151549 RepID=A0A4C1XX62_EUMVA|nr:hypothetical protein EVAR_90543_1 [Eumeta japonica]
MKNVETAGASITGMVTLRVPSTAVRTFRYSERTHDTRNYDKSVRRCRAKKTQSRQRNGRAVGRDSIKIRRVSGCGNYRRGYAYVCMRMCVCVCVFVCVLFTAFPYFPALVKICQPPYDEDGKFATCYSYLSKIE